MSDIPMIPGIIHYCWFGGKDIPVQFLRYMETWREHNPGYDIVLWNEENSPMDIPYMETALSGGKWANLSNYTRLHALNDRGGIYLDVDVEVLKSFDGLMENGCFVGFESGANPGEQLLVNNAVLGAVPGHPFVRECMEYLLGNFDGTERAPHSSPMMTTEILRKKGLETYGEQVVDGVKIYPVEYFYPLPFGDGDRSRVTEDTYAIHHWAATWKGKKKARPFRRLIRKFRRLFPGKEKWDL
jgi:mannosyltransferase OCH1-like enzyme